MPILNIIPFAHSLLKQHIKIGYHVLDGTIGNGHDTLFLAECVGQTGFIYGFDIQQDAIDATLDRLHLHGYQDNFQLIHASHAHIQDYVQQPIQAAIFNCGYRPGGDKSITTTTNTILPALEQTLTLLASRGIIVIVLYPGHIEGYQEMLAVEQWAKNLPQSTYSVLSYRFLNRQNNPPQLIAIERIDNLTKRD